MDDDSKSVSQSPEDQPQQPVSPPPTAVIQPTPANAEQKSTDDVQSDIKDLTDRVKTAEWWMIGLTAAIALFALGGVTVGILQWCAMRGQLGEMGRQSALMRDQLSSTQGASVKVMPDIEGGSLREGLNQIRLRIRNNSPSTASRVVGQFNIIRQTIPDGKQIWKSDDFKIGPETMESTPAGENRGLDPIYPITLSAAEVQQIQDMRITIAIHGTLEYWNGFEMAKDKVCSDLLFWLLKDKTGFVITNGGPEFHSCSEYDSQINTWFNTKRDWENKEWKNH